MRTILFLLLFSFGLSTASNAQAEFKINPIVLLFGGLILSCEQPISDQFGVEGTLIAVPDAGFGGYGLAKYYFKPNLGADRFYGGAFLGAGDFISQNAFFGLGFHVGYKIVARKGLLFEVNLGLGRALGSGFTEPIPHFKVDLGYRFGKKNLYATE